MCACDVNAVHVWCECVCVCVCVWMCDEDAHICARMGMTKTTLGSTQHVKINNNNNKHAHIAKCIISDNKDNTTIQSISEHFSSHRFLSPTRPLQKLTHCHNTKTSKPVLSLTMHQNFFPPRRNTKLFRSWSTWKRHTANRTCCKRPFFFSSRNCQSHSHRLRWLSSGF